MFIKLAFWHITLEALKEVLLCARLWTKATNQEVDIRIIGSLALTTVVSYHSLLWKGQRLLLI